MKTVYVEVIKARISVDTLDAMYGVQFDTEYRRGRTWEFDPMSDEIGQNMTVPTGNMRVYFHPIVESMKFPEDAKLQKEYIMDVQSARKLYKFLRADDTPYWFALALAREAQTRGLGDINLDAVAGCATCVEPV